LDGNRSQALGVESLESGTRRSRELDGSSYLPMERLAQDLAPLEARRRRTVLFALLLFLATPFWAYTLSFAFQALGLRGTGLFYALLVALPPGFALGLLYTLRLRFKEALVAPLAEALGFTYHPVPGLPQYEAEASGLLPRADRYESEDFLGGSVGPFSFRSSDIALYRRVHSRSGIVYIRFFSGALYRFALPFRIPGEIRLAPRGAAPQAGGVSPRAVLLFLAAFWGLFVVLLALGEAEGDARRALSTLDFVILLSLPFLVYGLGLWKLGRRERVALESGVFERLFDAYGDQTETRKLLTPRVQEALVEFRQAVGKPIWIAFRGNEAWVLIKGRNRFEPSLFRPLTPETLRAYTEGWTRDLKEAERLLQAVAELSSVCSIGA